MCVCGVKGWKGGRSRAELCISNVISSTLHSATYDSYTCGSEQDLSTFDNADELLAASTGDNGPEISNESAVDEIGD